MDKSFLEQKLAEFPFLEILRNKFRDREEFTFALKAFGTEREFDGEAKCVMHSLLISIMA